MANGIYLGQQISCLFPDRRFGRSGWAYKVKEVQKRTSLFKAALKELWPCFEKVPDTWYAIFVLPFRFWSQIMKPVLRITIFLRAYLEWSLNKHDHGTIFTSIRFPLLCLLLMVHHRERQVDKTSNRYLYKKSTPESLQKFASFPKYHMQIETSEKGRHHVSPAFQILKSKHLNVVKDKIVRARGGKYKI